MSWLFSKRSGTLRSRCRRCGKRTRGRSVKYVRQSGGGFSLSRAKPGRRSQPSSLPLARRRCRLKSVHHHHRRRRRISLEGAREQRWPCGSHSDKVCDIEEGHCLRVLTIVISRCEGMYGAARVEECELTREGEGGPGGGSPSYPVAQTDAIFQKRNTADKCRSIRMRCNTVDPFEQKPIT